MDVKVITPDGFFRVFTACAGDPKTLILDVRSNKDYGRKHVMQAYNIRLAANGQALLVRTLCSMCRLGCSYDQLVHCYKR